MNTAGSDWRPMKLDELGQVGRGKSRHRPRNAAFLYGGSYPFFQTGDIKATNFYLTEYSQTYSDAGLAQSKLWKPGTLCITIAANIAESAILGIEGCFPDSVVGFIADPEKADVRFVKYYLEILKLQMQNISHGSTQDNLSVEKLLSFDFLIPLLPIQRSIADILSAYDELIENSQRRINILESMARALYREWFVYFRFPGHESVPLVPSSLGEIPQGWEVTTLDEHLSGLESGKRPKGGIRDVVDGVPSIGAENINGIGQHDFIREKFIPREFFQEMRKGIVRDRDVAIYKDGAYIGKSSYFRDGFPHSECCVNEHVFLLRSSGVRLKQNAMYLWLQEPDTVQTIRSKNANAAQPGINQQTVGGLNLILPDSKTATHFDQLVDPLLAEVINLAKMIQNLRSTRDLLLPRLLSGQIDVEAMAS